MKQNLEPLPHGLSMAIDKDNCNEVVLSTTFCSGNERAHLFLVILSRYKHGYIYPIVSQYYIIAEDEARAINQVQRNAFPELGHYHESDTQDTLTATATRIPVQVRGWGHQTF